MKAERRHELQENDLAHMIEGIKANLSKNARSIGIGFLVVVAVFVVGGLVLRSSSAAEEDRWRRKGQLIFDKLETARESLDALAALSKDNSDRTFTMAALMDLARQSLNWSQKSDSGLDLALTEKAKEAFQDLLKRFPDNPMAVGFAHCGLATVEENLFILDRQSRHKEEARRHLRAIVGDPKMIAMPYYWIASRRLDALDQTFTFVPLVPAKVEPPTAAAVKPAVPSLAPSIGPADGAISLPGATLQVDTGTAPVAPMNYPTDEAGVDTADTDVDEEEKPAEQPIPKPNANP